MCMFRHQCISVSVVRQSRSICHHHSSYMTTGKKTKLKSCQTLSHAETCVCRRAALHMKEPDINQEKPEDSQNRPCLLLRTSRDLNTIGRDKDPERTDINKLLSKRQLQLD